ncbi:MAG: hypothetical protein ABIK08_04560 [Pseudomonadota bacterium]
MSTKFKTYVEPNATLKEALAGFPSLRPNADAEPPKPDAPGVVLVRTPTEAGFELDMLARQRMTMMPGETYRQALHAVMQTNPDLKRLYAKGE